MALAGEPAGSLPEVSPNEQPASTATNTAPDAAENTRATVVPLPVVMPRRILISPVPLLAVDAPVFVVVLADRNKDGTGSLNGKRDSVYFSRQRGERAPVNKEPHGPQLNMWATGVPG